MGFRRRDLAYQREAVERLHLPFPILSDASLLLTRALNLPTFSVDGMTLIKRMAWVIDDGVIAQAVLSGVPAGPERGAGDCLASGVQIGAHARKHLAKHLRRQHAGIRVVARAVIAAEERERPELRAAAVAERSVLQLVA